jgi:hypothetical protein
MGKKIVGIPHSRNYAADENAIALCVRAMAAVLVDRLNALTE